MTKLKLQYLRCCNLSPSDHPLNLSHVYKLYINSTAQQTSVKTSCSVTLLFLFSFFFFYWPVLENQIKSISDFRSAPSIED